MLKQMSQTIYNVNNIQNVANREMPPRRIAYLLVFLVMINSGFALATAFPKIQPIGLFLTMATILFIMTIKGGARLLDKGLVIAVLMLIILTCITILSCNDFAAIITHAQFVMIILVSGAILLILPFHEIAKAYTNILSIMTIYAITVHLLFSGNAGYASILKVSNEQVDYAFYGLSSIIVNHPERLSGWFWEPGQYHVYLSYAVIFEVWLKDNLSKWRIGIFFVAIVLTFSTTGYILFPILITYVLSARLRPTIRNVIYMGVCLAALVLLFNAKSVVNNLVRFAPDVFSKIDSFDTSSKTRLYGPLLDLDVFYKHPVFGAGYKTRDAYYQQNAVTRAYSLTGRTSTFTAWLASNGIVMTLLIFVLFAYSWSFMGRTRLESAVLILYMVTVYSSQPMNMSLFSSIVMMQGVYRFRYRSCNL